MLRKDWGLRMSKDEIIDAKLLTISEKIGSQIPFSGPEVYLCAKHYFDFLKKQGYYNDEAFIITRKTLKDNADMAAYYDMKLIHMPLPFISSLDKLALAIRNLKKHVWKKRNKSGGKSGR